MPIPYNLKVTEEERIYHKMISESDVSDVHIAPHTLKVAAMFSILTRLKEPKRSDIDLVKKCVCMTERVSKASNQSTLMR